MKIATEFTQDLLTMPDHQVYTATLAFEIARATAFVAGVAFGVLALAFLGVFATPSLLLASYISFELAGVAHNAVNLIRSRDTVAGALKVVGAWLSSNYAEDKIFNNAPVIRLVCLCIEKGVN